MRIREVEQLTGLTRKSIQFYEKKGLLSVARSENTYREYTDADVAQLRTIATLRKAGVSLSDIQLWQDGVISTEEMLNKRLSELMDSTSVAVGQAGLCHELLDGLVDGLLMLPRGGVGTDAEPIDEGEAPILPAAGREAAAGIDIGTTTISAVVLDASDGTQLGAYTIRSESFLPAAEPWEKTQRPDVILGRVRLLLSSLRKRYPAIRSLGLSGQMHGILYLDADGQPLSPLYTWQDGRAGLGSPSACDEILARTGYRVSPGYGLATAYSQLREGRVPEGAACLCTIMDYVGMALCGLSRPLMHVTNAASLGFMAPGASDFDRAALSSLGFPLSLLPEVTGKTRLLGTSDGLPVSVAVGDNQASFLGAVTDHAHTALANFGTGSQISLLSEEPTEASGSIECRPYFDGLYLQSGSALCGGRAYRLLERFFASYAAAAGLPSEEQYETINRLAEKGLALSDLPRVSTTFCGTRDDPSLRGGFADVGEANFTPEAFTAGVLVGMAEELKIMFDRMPHGDVTALVASGNAARLNPALCRALERVFGLPVTLPARTEEAACGAAVFGRRAAGA